ncbi:hypothetical protein BDR03DRAFT_965290 [Suillus americanus]|nr:hypothetical protein BDR03DRAFT_965290 [Suillus americanus]
MAVIIVCCLGRDREEDADERNPAYKLVYTVNQVRNVSSLCFGSSTIRDEISNRWIWPVQ